MGERNGKEIRCSFAGCGRTATHYGRNHRTGEEGVAVCQGHKKIMQNIGMSFEPIDDEAESTISSR